MFIYKVWNRPKECDNPGDTCHLFVQDNMYKSQNVYITKTKTSYFEIIFLIYRSKVL